MSALVPFTWVSTLQMPTFPARITRSFWWTIVIMPFFRAAQLSNGARMIVAPRPFSCRVSDAGHSTAANDRGTHSIALPVDGRGQRTEKNNYADRIHVNPAFGIR